MYHSSLLSHQAIQVGQKPKVMLTHKQIDYNSKKEIRKIVLQKLNF